MATEGLTTDQRAYVDYWLRRREEYCADKPASAWYYARGMPTHFAPRTGVPYRITAPMQYHVLLSCRSRVTLWDRVAAMFYKRDWASTGGGPGHSSD